MISFMSASSAPMSVMLTGIAKKMVFAGQDMTLSYLQQWHIMARNRQFRAAGVQEQFFLQTVI